MMSSLVLLLLSTQVLAANKTPEQIQAEADKAIQAAEDQKHKEFVEEERRRLAAEEKKLKAEADRKVAKKKAQDHFKSEKNVILPKLLATGSMYALILSYVFTYLVKDEGSSTRIAANFIMIALNLMWFTDSTNKLALTWGMLFAGSLFAMLHAIARVDLGILGSSRASILTFLMKGDGPLVDQDTKQQRKLYDLSKFLKPDPSSAAYNKIESVTIGIGFFMAFLFIVSGISLWLYHFGDEMWTGLFIGGALFVFSAILAHNGNNVAKNKKFAEDRWYVTFIFLILGPILLVVKATVDSF